MGSDWIHTVDTVEISVSAVPKFLILLFLLHIFFYLLSNFSLDIQFTACK